MSLSARLSLTDSFKRCANDLPSRRETSGQLVTKRPSLFPGFNRLDCFANVESSEAARQISRAEALLNDVIIMIIIIISLRKTSARRQSLTLMRHRAELTSARSYSRLDSPRFVPAITIRQDNSGLASPMCVRGLSEPDKPFRERRMRVYRVIADIRR